MASRAQGDASLLHSQNPPDSGEMWLPLKASLLFYTQIPAHPSEYSVMSSSIGPSLAGNAMGLTVLVSVWLLPQSFES